MGFRSGRKRNCTVLAYTVLLGISSLYLYQFLSIVQQLGTENFHVKSQYNVVYCKIFLMDFMKVYTFEYFTQQIFKKYMYTACRLQWARGLRLRSAVARLLKSWVRIPPRAWMFVCCECCVLSGRGLCDELITRLEESYRLWCVVVCDLENLKNEEAMTRVGSQGHSKKKK